MIDIKEMKMPEYEYKCVATNKIYEINHSAGLHPDECPYCGAQLKRIWSAPSLSFNAEGFTKSTDPIYEHKHNQ